MSNLVLVCAMAVMSFYNIAYENCDYIIDMVEEITYSQEHTLTLMEYESIGDWFITAYCPEECGYRVYSDGSDNFPNGWITATGTIAHREKEWYEPSTCGINTALLNYGDVFLIDGKVFVAEDTGYVTGRLIDTFQPSYELMMTHGSHWTEVFRVHYVETEPINDKHLDINSYLGCPYREEEERLWMNLKTKSYQ